VCFYLPYLIFMGWYLFQVQPFLVFTLLIAFIPSIVSNVFRSRVFKKAEDQAASLRREYDSYELCICGRELFMETRFLGAFGYFFNRCRQTLSKLNIVSLKASKKANLFESFMKIITAAGYVLILVMMYFMILNRQISVGAFAAVFTSINALYYLMNELITYQLGEIARCFGSTQNLIAFLNIEEVKGVDQEIELRDSLVFDNVSFSYPGTERQAVDHVSFKVRQRETIAIVGKNGSGKTTLMRLLMGLYKPDSGSISVDGKDISDYSLRAVTKNISAVFQKYKRYQMTLKDNITISKTNQEADDAVVDRSIQMAGIDIKDENLVKGKDTLLSREFGGVDVSGGQWQRIAIARGYFRDHSLIVLDEPTAAIDPLEETKIYERFIKMSINKTTFIITHRLGSVRCADRIFVMDEGKLIETGTHDELMANGAIYAQMYNMQKERYE